MTYANEDTYQGEFLDNGKHGFGRLRVLNGIPRDMSNDPDYIRGRFRHRKLDIKSYLQIDSFNYDGDWEYD